MHECRRAGSLSLNKSKANFTKLKKHVTAMVTQHGIKRIISAFETQVNRPAV